jgi:epoxyqueuosine reductase
VTTPVTVTAAELAAELARLCPEHGIELAGAATLPAVLPHEARWRDWLAAGRHGDLDYLARDPAGRADPTRANPWATTLLVFGQRYTDGWSAADTDPSATGDPAPDAPWTARVARYARGRDYHDVLLGALKRLLGRLRERWPELRAHPATDTGPYLEREWAWLAGLGFLGRNTCLIHERLGSGLFLGVAPTNLAVAGLPRPGEPAAEPLYGLVPRRARPVGPVPATRCGTCTRCLEACPTGALDLVHGLDAHLCLSTWTIEWRGRAPAAQRAEQGGIVFGCDICQAVCPWNRRAARRAGGPLLTDAYAADPAHDEIDLAGLITLADEEFRSRLRRTPLWRAHPAGLRRNALVAAANAGRRDLLAAVEEACAAEDPETAAVATWARRRLTDAAADHR